MATAEKMTAAEKLLLLLSERKKAIIERVRQQTESYSQYLASKLLVQGIDPPSWLLDPINSGSKELNKEDLNCKHQSQYHPPSAICSIARYPGHNHVVITGDHEKVSDEEAVEIPAPNEDLDRRNDPAAPGFVNENHGECALNSVPELDASAASPEDQTDRIVDKENLSDEEVVEIPAPNEDLDRRNDPAAPGFVNENHGEWALNSVPELDASAASPEDQTDRIVDKENLSDEEVVKIPAPNEDLDQKNDPATPGFVNENHGECAINSVPELDASAASPEDQTDRILDNENIIDEEVVKIPAPNEDLDQKNDPATPGFVNENHGECAINSVPELDASAASPEDQTDRILDNENIIDEEVVKIPAPNEDLDQKNDPATPGFVNENHSECAIKSLPVLHASAALPEDQTDRILDNYIVPDQLLVRFQRSKSRQKALELRSSAKATAKSCLRHESTSDVISSQIRFSLSVTNKEGQNDELTQLEEPCTIGSQRSEKRNVVEDHCLSREVGVAALSESRCETYAEVPISVLGFFPLGCTSEDYQENGSSQDARIKNKESLPLSDLEPTDNHIKSPTSAGPSSVCRQSIRDSVEEDANFLCEDEEKSVYTGEITSLGISCRRQSCGYDSTKAGTSFDDCQGVDITMKLAHLEEPYSQRSEKRNVVEAHCLSREVGVAALSESRSETYAEVPISVVGSLPLGCSSENYKEDARVKSKESITLSDTEHADNHVKSPKLAGPSAVCRQSIKDSAEEDSNFLNEDEERNVYTGEITRSEFFYRRQSCGYDSTKAGTSFDDYQGIDVTMKDAGDALTLDSAGLESSPVHCVEQLLFEEQSWRSKCDILKVSCSSENSGLLVESDTIDGNFNDEASDKDQLVSTAPESSNSMLSYGQNSAKDQQSQILSWPESEVISKHRDSSLENNFLRRPSTIRLDDKNSSHERSVREVRIESWPQVKRRKIEHQQAQGFASSQRFRVTKPHTFQRDPDITSPKTMEIDTYTGHVALGEKSSDDGICSEVNTNLMEGIQSAMLSQHGEVESSYIENNEYKPPVINNEQLVATISSLAMKESRNSQGCFIEGTRTSPSSCDYLDARVSGDEQCRQNLSNLGNNTDNLSSESLNLSTLHEDLHLTDDVDQSMPVFEGFMVNAETDTVEMDFPADGFDLAKLELPRTTLERVSILAEICRSAISDRLSSQFSSAFKFDSTGNLCKSLSGDGHLENMDFGNNYPSDDGIHFQSCSSSSDDCTDALDGMPYSVSVAYSGERYGWDSRNQPLSPVGKLWNQLSSHKGSAGKRSSSNPEFTCFPIDEDPGSSEENKTIEENAVDIQDETDSPLANHCDKRQPLQDLTNMCTNPPISMSAEEETSRADSLDFLRTKDSVTGIQDKVFLGQKYQSRKNSETSEKQTSYTRVADGRKHQLSSIGPKAIKRAKESVSNSISKPFMSNKTSLKGPDQKLSLREPRRNNIVSDVSSFIPLIQQKQAAAACQGKRDVKVKALEAAEAAKRLEDQKEIERKKRKEALKLERAKLEEKNLKQMELEKKRKEEERKKKDAEIITKKRLREELEKKEKKMKRIRLESRQQQREQEEKKRVMRSEKENQRAKDDQMNRKKELNKESKRKQNSEMTRGEGAALQKMDDNLTINEVVVNYEECGTSGLSCDGEGMHAADKSSRNEDFIAQNSKGISYEISPYKCSDDEDEEDDELPTKKNIPSWASKSAVALFLPLQRELDPDVIFPLESFCSEDEVLLPRNLQKKQGAA